MQEQHVALFVKKFNAYSINNKARSRVLQSLGRLLVANAHRVGKAKKYVSCLSYFQKILSCVKKREKLSWKYEAIFL